GDLQIVVSGQARIEQLRLMVVDWRSGRDLRAPGIAVDYAIRAAARGCRLVDSLTVHGLHQLRRVHVIERLRGRERVACRPGVTALGCDQHNAVGSTCTIDRCCGTALEDFDGLDIRG